MLNPITTDSAPTNPTAASAKTAHAARDSAPSDSDAPIQSPEPANTGPLLPVFTTLKPEQVLEAASKMSKRGRLPGFARENPPNLFSALAFSHPFDHRLLVTASADPATPARTRLDFTLRLLPKIPAIVLVVFALSAWPGVWLTHSMLTTYFPSWYTIPLFALWSTSTWYLPLTVGPLPFMWRRMMRNSKAAAHADALDIIKKIDAELNQ